jgi:hypothetical protein
MALSNIGMARWMIPALWCVTAMAQPSPPTREEFSRAFGVAERVHEAAMWQVRGAVYSKFAERMRQIYSDPLPAGALKPFDIQRVLIELDAIADRLVLATGTTSAALAPRIEAVAFQPGHFVVPMFLDLKNPQVMQWAESSALEIARLRRLDHYRMALGVLLGNASSAEARSAPPVNKDFGLGEAFADQRRLARAWAESPAIAAVIPARFDIVGLAAQSVQNEATARRLRIPVVGDMETAAYRAAAKLNGDVWGTDRLTADQFKPVETVVDRVSYLVDPRVMGRCDSVRSAVAASGGDWRRVPGLRPGGAEHFAIFLYAVSGCSGQRDTTMARRVLEDISAAPMPSSTSDSLQSSRRHCILRSWLQQGIGGVRDLSLAARVNERYRLEAWGLGPNATREDIAAMAARSPEAARENFGCPAGPAPIDPQDPWRSSR